MSKKITAVIVGRNDDYSGDLDSRAVPALSSMLEEFDEVIYVDFNSQEKSYLELIRDTIPSTKRFKHILVTPADVKKLDVSESFQQNWLNKFNESWARNIGIRRATHDYVVSTNIDIICKRPEDEAFDDNILYTAARRDVPIEVYKQIPQESLKEILLHNTEKFPAKPRVLDEEGNPIWDENDLWSVVVCCGDFQLAHKNVWEKIRGFEERDTEGEPTGRAYLDTNIMKKAKLSGFGIDKIDIDIFHLNHNTPKYINTENTTKRNSQKEFVQDFETTSNDESWGHINHTFSEEII